MQRHRSIAWYCATAGLTAALSLAVSTPPRAQDAISREDAARQLEDRKRALETARGKEDKLRRDLKILEKERAELNTKLIDTARRVQASEARLTAIEERLGQYEEQEELLRGSIKKRHEDIGKLLSAMQTIGGDPPPALVARRDDALAMVRSAMLMASIFPELKFQADNLADDLADLIRLSEGIRRERAAERAESEKLNKEQIRIAALIEEKKSRQLLSRSKLEQIRKAAKRHAREVTYLGELLERMKKELAAADAGLDKYEKELIEARTRQRLLQTPSTTVEIKPDKKQKVAFLSPGRIKPAISFDQAKGALPRPAHGETYLNFGDALAHGGVSQGQWVRTRKSARVVSPADGWIVYAGEFRSYGQLLIIDAGGGYHVLLAGMKRIDAEVGQFVLANEPVALMGKQGPDNKEDRPALYIEFRKSGRPVNPAPWWAGIPEKVQG